ncbi:hypothetical protein V8J88_21220 [Massilia sp. W12]|uniref:hypothetical protein n=1 Tax=Massilia sp. W12 TaxID=3126507 RepID=UPI0030D3433B
MLMLRMLFCILLSSALTPVSAAGLNFSGSNCELSAPPKDALQREQRGMALQIYPGALPPNYSGCRKFWLSNQQLMANLQYQKGQLKHAEITEPKSRPFQCQYANNQLLSAKSDRRCPTPQDLAE